MMSSAVRSLGAGREGNRTRGLRVTNWPLRDRPGHALATLAGCLAVGTICGISSASGAMGLLATAALLLAFWKLWVPVTTEFEPRGVLLTTWWTRLRFAWRDIDHLELRPGGVFLCSESRPLARAAIRSVFLPWGTERETLTQFCEEYQPLEYTDWSGATQISATPPRP